MAPETDQVAPEVQEALDALAQVEQTALEELPTSRGDLDACWQRILARVRGQVSQA